MTWNSRAMSITVGLALMTVVASIAGDSNQENDGNWKCENKSIHWNEEVHQNLTSQCGNLKMPYDKQYCNLTNSTLLHCMVERARMHDGRSCKCYQGDDVYSDVCFYEELCAFVDPKFQPDDSYKCDVDENGQMTCVAKGHPTYVNNCIRGLLYCPETLCVATPARFYADACGCTYQEIFGEGKTVYYITRIHFNASNYVFSKVKEFAARDTNPCTGKPTAVDDDIILLAIVSASALLIIVLPICVWRVRRRRAKEDERWISILSNTLDFLTKFIQNGVRANDTTELTEIAEKVDPIVAEYLSHSDAEVQECLLGKETSIENTNDLTEAEDNHNTKTHNVHSISSCNTDSTVSLNMVASLSLHEDSLNDDNRSANISLPAVSDSRESVFEPDEPISSHQLSQNGATEASAHDPTVNMYENPSYGQESSGYIPKTFDFDQKDN